MVKIIALSELHGEIENLIEIVSEIKKNVKFDYVVFTGDLLSVEKVKQ